MGNEFPFALAYSQNCPLLSLVYNFFRRKVTQGANLDEKIEKAIKDNPNVTTEDLAKQFGVTSMTIKRHIAKMQHIRYVGSGYSGHWEVDAS